MASRRLWPLRALTSSPLRVNVITVSNFYKFRVFVPFVISYKPVVVFSEVAVVVEKRIVMIRAFVRRRFKKHP